MSIDDEDMAFSGPLQDSSGRIGGNQVNPLNEMNDEDEDAWCSRKDESSYFVDYDVGTLEKNLEFQVQSDFADLERRQKEQEEFRELFGDQGREHKFEKTQMVGDLQNKLNKRYKGPSSLGESIHDIAELSEEDYRKDTQQMRKQEERPSELEAEDLKLAEFDSIMKTLHNQSRVIAEKKEEEEVNHSDIQIKVEQPKEEEAVHKRASG